MNVITALLIILCVAHTVFDALSDAIKDETGKTKHWMQSSMIVFIMTAYYLQYWLGFDPFFVIYLVLIRYSLFDIIYNDRMGHDLNYHGSTNHWYVKFLNTLPPWLEYSSRIITFILIFIIGYLSGIYFI